MIPAKTSWSPTEQMLAKQSSKSRIGSWPRILALHGGGTNARIFRAQCRALETEFGAHGFRVVYVEAPFPSVPGPDVLSVYSKWGPFKGWLRSPDILAPTLEDVHSVKDTILQAMMTDDQHGASGPWIAVMGFSQGAKVAASILLAQQNLLLGPWNFYFGLFLAGRGPFLDFCPEIPADKRDVVLYMDSIHVHGLRDPGLEKHRKMYEAYCDPLSRRLITWDGDHRVPLKTKDVQKIMQSFLGLVLEMGISYRTE